MLRMQRDLRAGGPSFLNGISHPHWQDQYHHLKIQHAPVTQGRWKANTGCTLRPQRGKVLTDFSWRVPVPNPIVSVTSSAWSAWDLLSFSTMSHSALRPKRTRTVGHPTSGQGYHLKWCLSALKVHTQHLWCLLKFTSGFSILGWGLSFCMSNKLSDDTSAGASLGTTLWVSGFRAYFVDC